MAALADGAGSAQFSDEGAQTAVDVIIREIANAHENTSFDFAEVMRTAVSKARDALIALATSRECQPRQLASTLLAVISTERGGAAAHIGDGVIVVNQGEDELGWVFWPQRGEYANTTRFLTDEDALAQLKVETFARPLSDFALTSDGLEPLALHYASQTVHSPFFAAMFQPLLASNDDGRLDRLCRDLESFLSSPIIGSRTDDDVSLVLATCRREK